MPSPLKRLIIFSNLDGALLDAQKCSFTAATPALGVLKRKQIPLILCSSRTRREIEHYRRALTNEHPFISESGGGVFIPKGYFDFEPSSSDCLFKEEGGYYVIKLGADYSILRKVMSELRREGFNIKGYGDMTAQDIVFLTGMDADQAEMSKEREFSEPFIAKGGNLFVEEILAAIRKRGFSLTRERFYHLIKGNDLRKAVSIVTELYSYVGISTAAVGYGPNDLPMLECVDYPIIVQQSDGSYHPDINIPRFIKADGIGPDGWSKAILRLVG